MKPMNSKSAIRDDRGDTHEVLRSINPSVRLWIGLIICALVSYYVLLLMLASIGIWVNNLTFVLQLLVVGGVLVVQNFVGYRLNKVLLAGAPLAVLVDCYEVVNTAHEYTLGQWHLWWIMFFFPTACCLLNAFLFLAYKAMAKID